MTAPTSDASTAGGTIPASDGPVPAASVPALAVLAARLAFRTDPVGLLAIPFVIFFPVYVFLTLLAEILRYPEQIGAQVGLMGVVAGALPIVVFARVLGEAWLLERTDALAHGRRPGLGATFTSALGRSWYLVSVMVGIYALVQIGIFLLVVPAFVVGVLFSFANQAAVLGPGGFRASLMKSRDLLRGNFTAWLGMVGLWCAVFVGLGVAVGFLRHFMGGITGQNPGFVQDLLLGLPLQVGILVFTVCWTLFYRELEARVERRAQHAPMAKIAAAPADMAAVPAEMAAVPADVAAVPAAPEPAAAVPTPEPARHAGG